MSEYPDGRHSFDSDASANYLAGEKLMTVTSARLAVTVMAKAPIAGEAKTRLGREIGYPAAAALYRGLLRDTLAVIADLLPSSSASHRSVVCPDQRHLGLLTSMIPPNWTATAQRRIGLMGGIVDAFDEAFQDGADITVVTDADSPYALLEHLVPCADLAGRHDVILGPTTDGGYYLIAARRDAWSQLPELLLGTTFQSDTICRATVERAVALDLSAELGAVSYDIDTASDLARFTLDLSLTPAHQLRFSRSACAAFGSEKVVGFNRPTVSPTEH